MAIGLSHSNAATPSRAESAIAMPITQKRTSRATRSCPWIPRRCRSQPARSVTMLSGHTQAQKLRPPTSR